MSKEAMKLALEFIEQVDYPPYDAKPVITALHQALANEALDKKAENARKLGLDYEPVWGGGPTNKDYEDAMRQRRLDQLTSPPAQRTWQGLTDEAIWLEYQRFWPFHPPEEPTLAKDIVKFAELIEAKLKEKNT